MNSRGKRAAYFGLVTEDGVISFPLTEANIAMQAETCPLKHGEGEPWTRPLTEAEQEDIRKYEAARQILPNER